MYTIYDLTSQKRYYSKELAEAEKYWEKCCNKNHEVEYWNENHLERYYEVPIYHIKTTRGGKRNGAGRKSLGRRMPITVRISYTAFNKLSMLQEELNKSQSGVIEDLLMFTTIKKAPRITTENLKS